MGLRSILTTVGVTSLKPTGSYLRLHHIPHWLPIAIRINKAICNLPFFFFFAFPTSSSEYFLASRCAQGMPDDLKICKHTFSFYLFSCLHMFFPQFDVLSTSTLPKVVFKWLCEAFVNHPWRADPSHLGNYHVWPSLS